MKEIIFLTPIFKEMIWGGERLKTEFGYDIPSDHTGECWGVSAHEHGDCIVSDGSFKGKSLSYLWEHHRELFGSLPMDCFPLLTKIIDTKTDLSIQVHPDNEYANIHENGSLGKTECWYILDCDEDAKIVIGHHAADKEEMKSMILNKEWDKFIRVVDLKKGDFFQIDHGCVHAIKGGSLILETQQNSDITYRVYDYDRLSGGSLRELHIQKSMDIITAPFIEKNINPQKEIGQGYQKTHFITTEYYTVEKLDITETVTMKQEKPFLIMSVIEGSGFIDKQAITKGRHFIIPYEYGEFVLEGTMTIIQSYV
jgi:Phosphomannose isomerase